MYTWQLYDYLLYFIHLGVSLNGGTPKTAQNDHL